MLTAPSVHLSCETQLLAWACKCWCLTHRLSSQENAQRQLTKLGDLGGVQIQGAAHLKHPLWTWPQAGILQLLTQ